ncbi:MAG: hypothetical protein PWQ57_167 [Desulfovibrionales bacterium]|nr:hypothetical protein [Desulfovibrionales bacterium]
MKLNFSRDAAFYIAMCVFPIYGMFSEGELLSRFDVKTEFFAARDGGQDHMRDVASNTPLGGVEISATA